MEGAIETLINRMLADLECVALALIIVGLLWDRRRLLAVLREQRIEQDRLHEARLEDHAILAERATETAVTLQKLTMVVESLRGR